jgi:hypothetical protein
MRIERPGNHNRIVANAVPGFVALQVENDIFDHEPAPECEYRLNCHARTSTRLMHIKSQALQRLGAVDYLRLT